MVPCSVGWQRPDGWDAKFSPTIVWRPRSGCNKPATTRSTAPCCRYRSQSRRRIAELDVRNAKAPPRFEVKAPAGAPNVLIVLIDDMGFGQSSAFGGPIHMPTAERLAKNGLRYNQFHTTALCSPTRAALLSGRNHHVCNMGSITETATAFPGQTGQRPNSVAPLGGDAAFERVRHGRLWQVARDRGLGGQYVRTRPIAGRRGRASTSSTGSSAARPINGRPRSTTG